MEIDFVRSNPALDEYYRAQKLASEQDTAEAKNKYLKQATDRARFELQQQQAEAPTRLRQMNAQADLAQTQASYAPQMAQTELQQKRAQIAQALAGISNNQATMAMRVYQLQLERASQGDIMGAKALAQQTGIQGMPDEVLQNNQSIGAMQAIINNAQTRNPNSAKDQMGYIMSYIAELHARQQQGQSVSPQEAPYMQNVPNAPAPAIQPNVKLGENERIINRIQQAYQERTGKPLPYEQAVEIAHGRTSQSQIELGRMAQKDAAQDDSTDDYLTKLNRARANYGLTPLGNTASTPQADIPSRPRNLPAGSAYSPSRKMWRDPQGNLYDASGNPLETSSQDSGSSTTTAVPFPELPLSQ